MLYFGQNQVIDKSRIIKAKASPRPPQSLASFLLTKMHKKTQGPGLSPQLSQANWGLSATLERGGA